MTPATGPGDTGAAVRRRRIVQWATGNIGTYALRAVIEHPNLELAGLYVHSPAKAGRDAGELCGLGPTGVIASHDVEEIVALGADCVLYMPRACDFDEVGKLLASGANVVTTTGGFHRAESLDPAVRQRIGAACDAGNASIHSTGSSPGFISEAVPLVLSSIQRRLAGLTIDEFANLSQRDSPGLLFDVMGFGKPPAHIDERRLSHGRTSFGPSLHLVADALSMPLDDVEATGEVAVARQPVSIAAGTLEAGTVAAQRLTVSGMRNGRPLLRFRANWYCTTEIDPPRGTSGTPAGGLRSTATRRSTSTSASPCHWSAWPRPRRLTRPTVRSTPSRPSAPRRPESIRCSTCPTSSRCSAPRGPAGRGHPSRKPPNRRGNHDEQRWRAALPALRPAGAAVRHAPQGPVQGGAGAVRLG